MAENCIPEARAGTTGLMKIAGKLGCKHLNQGPVVTDRLHRRLQATPGQLNGVDVYVWRKLILPPAE